MRSTASSSEQGLIRGGLLLVLLLAVGLGAGWWFFLGRYRLPETPPARAESVAPVIDYVGRRELGTDPLGQMEKPSLPDAGRTGAEAALHLSKWAAAYGTASVARAKWKAAEAVGVVSDVLPTTSLHLDYLHEAQLAEYWRARYVNAQEGS